MITRALRQVRLRRARRTWRLVSPLIILYLASGLGRLGCGFRGSTMFQIVHGGLFYVSLPAQEFPQGFIARGDHYFLDWRYTNATERDGTHYIFLPLWPFVGVATAAAVVATALAMRRAVGGCPECGYDAKGLGTCPECGASLAPAAA